MLRPNVKKLKEYAYELKEQYDQSGWFKRIGIKSRLTIVLDEIDYQEGRLQFANRPYSFPSVRIKGCTGNSVSCDCGCWEEVRVKHFNL
jgi:hypothetical protein